MERHEIDAAVIGAGAVGLAIARQLALRGLDVVVIEQNSAFGTETSARNSGVIHAGLYYPPDSFKARVCVDGKHALYEYCERRKVAHRRCGKLVVSNAPEEDEGLERIAGRAAACGVEVDWLTGAQARAMEPAVKARAALHSPSTGIVDQHGLMLSLLGEAEDRGAALARNARFERAEPLPDGRLALEIGGAAPMVLSVRHAAFACGLWSAEAARRIVGLDPALIPTLHFARGCYFRLAGPAPFSRLIYPAPEYSGALGIHLTLDLEGGAKFGPDLEWLDVEDPAELAYTVDPERAQAFHAQIRRYWPDLPEGALTPESCGVRPKLNGPGEPAQDFRIDGPETHGLGGHAILHGIESPGLTACLALAEAAAARMLS